MSLHAEASIFVQVRLHRNGPLKAPITGIASPNSASIHQCPPTQMYPPQVFRRVSQLTPLAKSIRSPPIKSLITNSHMWISTHAKIIITKSHTYPYT